MANPDPSRTYLEEAQKTLVTVMANDHTLTRASSPWID